MIGTLRTVVLDAPDARRLAAFYTALGGWTEQYADDEWITMETGDGWRIAAQLSPGHVPPRWPDPAYPQQAHLDLRVPDLDAGSAKAAGLGAELLRKNENWYTLADPAGHPFDLCLFPAKQETTLMGVMLDCPDARELSTFYAKLLGKPITYEGEGVAMIAALGVNVRICRIQRARSGRDMAGRRGNWLWGNPEVQIRAFCALAEDLRTAIAGRHPGVFADAELVCVRRAIGWAWYGLGGNLGISQAVA